MSVVYLHRTRLTNAAGAAYRRRGRLRMLNAIATDNPGNDSTDLEFVAMQYVHQQAVPASVWVVVHGMGKFPAVTVVDSAGDECEGDVRHDSDQQVTITFSAPFAGRCFCC